ncbi:PSD1 and planctomycete cytochrome C domain-containing protein [Horticoccus sp. 23ND18S-11]|uniref:PSD1 and planctomycete cytochrome C domain-containing protein n=1 Tax=Horticoccus sp. 23ND18S-11 TaxID=3391832 RepID=UPI0039C9EE1A
MLRPYLCLLVASLGGPLPAGFAASAPTAASAPSVSFNRDIRPILSDICFHCHGNDPKSRKAGLRLDLRDEALKPTKNDLLPIVPGKPHDSEIILRIMDAQDPMPPEESHKRLTPEQKELFRRWVAEGAVYEPHWAYAPLVKPAVPAIGAAHPIDAFIRAKLAEKKISPSPEAARTRLLRRVSLDLTGLPPTPEEVAAFLADDRPGAYERQVDRLLASPRHGERMTVWWLDIARFTDTVGFHGDQNQRIFPYRDYVIDAFNTNKRFDQFTIEQLAGDLLPNPTTAQRVATGYNRLNMMTREGGAQPKEYLSKYGAERVRSVAAAWFGSTFGCAECHDHKFDPIKARDFYELQSFFADVKQWGVYSDYGYTKNPDLEGFTNDHPFPPEIEVDSAYLQARQREAESALAAHRATTRARWREAGATATLESWIAESQAWLAQQPAGWQQPPLTATLVRGNKPAAGVSVAIDDQLTVFHRTPLARGESLKLTLQPSPGRLAAIRLDVIDEPVRDSAQRKNAAARNALRLAASIRGTDGKERKLEFVYADATVKEARYENGTDVLGIVGGWKVPSGNNPGRPSGIWLLATPQVLTTDEALVLTVTGEAAMPLRVAVSPFGAEDPLAVASEPLRAALHANAAMRTPAQRDLIADTWLLSTADDRAAFDRQHQLAAAVRATRNGRASTLVTQAWDPIEVRVLPRGNWQDESGPVVLPATPSFLPGRIESTEGRRLTRLDLARWIVSNDNPITARTVMNRLWQQCFGTGLSAAVDDLGSQGELPSHPELLDWMAGEFRDRGWDLRHMLRLMVTSATYRQSSSLRPELRELDPNNRLLASQNPRRLEAEFIRDNALFVAGALNLKDIGGPSAKPYQPAGYYEALQFPNRDYMASKDDSQWRRGVYMHWQRTFLHPMLANFDAPARDECAAQRVISNTPQQALTLLNDPTFVEAARLFAARVHASGTTDPMRLRQAFLLALGREPRAAETASLQTFLAGQRDYYRSNVAEAEKLIRVGFSPPPSGDAAELAAWTSLGRVLLNSQEVITRY